MMKPTPSLGQPGVLLLGVAIGTVGTLFWIYVVPAVLGAIALL